MSLSSTDVIALVSIGSSAVIAVVSVAATLVGARGQRKHDAQLAFEARAWERKVDAHLGLIKAVLAVRKAATEEPTWSQIRALRQAHDDVVNEVEPTLSAYATAACLRDLESWLGLLAEPLEKFDLPLKRLNIALEDLTKQTTATLAEGVDPVKAVIPFVATFQERASTLEKEFFYPREAVLAANDALLISTRASLKGV